MLEFKRQKLIKLVFKYFNAYTCQTVSDEFSKGISKASEDNKATNRLLSKKKNNIFPISRNVEVIEEKLLELKYIETLSEKDKGERHLVSLAIEQVYLNKFSQCIVLSDDQSAIDGFIDKIHCDFRFGTVWTVFDLVIFLFFKCKITSEETEYAIRELIGSTSISVKKYRIYKNRRFTENEARQILLKETLRRLKNLKTVLNALPRR
jgi:hypothetical protein